MSVEWYLGCRDCETKIHIASDGLSGFRYFSGEPQCQKVMGEFFAEHVFHPDHRIIYVQEQSEEDDTYREIEWEAK